MSLQQFAQENAQVKVILIGESHNNATDADAVLSIVKIFEDRGHNLTFYFEHFPGQVDQHEALSKGQISPKEFMKTPLVYPGKNGDVRQSPEEYWGHPEESAKLERLMQFAQDRFIVIKGHDLVQKDFSSKGLNDWLGRRDVWMVNYMMSDIRQTRFGTAVGFVGRAHVKPQAHLLRQYLDPETVITLCPDTDGSAASGTIVKSGSGARRDYTFTP